MRIAVGLGVVLALGHDARADWRDFKGTGSIDYEAGYVGAYHAGDDPPLDGLGLAGFRLRGQVSPSSWVGYRVGLDLRAGTTFPGGFAYDCDLYLVGVGARIKEHLLLGVTGGVGASGAVGTVDDAVTLPIEAAFELALGPRVRLLARGRIAWVSGAGSRDDGSPTIDFADELDAAVALRFGNSWHDWGFPTGNGYYVGASYREAEGIKMVGLILGHSLNAGTD
jgi:hypothetical protein